MLEQFKAEQYLEEAQTALQARVSRGEIYL